MEQKSLDEVAKVIEKLNFEWSWYADYPSASSWTEEFSEEDYKESLDTLVSKGENSPLSLYFHFPFCPKQCFYCVCSNETTKSRVKVNDFLQYQFKEIEMLRDFFDKRSFNPNIQAVHFGGGSPSFMNEGEIERLVKEMSSILDVGNLKEFSIEIDPRTVSEDKLIYYNDLGINRISLGVQDFNPDVQREINRVQPIELIEDLLTSEVRERFDSINFDLITGLPFQTRESFRDTIDKVVEFSPDKISSSFFCYMPEVTKHQQRIDSSKIPSFYESTMIFLETHKRLLEEDYLYIGMGHFVKPTDSLAISLRNKTLGRSAMGYTSGISEDLIGLGPWAMGRISNYYTQNRKPAKAYCESIEKNEFPTFRGYILNQDDLVRREIIRDVVCFSSVNFNKIEKKYDLDFKDHFRRELKSLQPYIEEGILEMHPEGFDLTPVGKFFQRHVCSSFDKFFQEKQSYKHSLDISK